MAVGGIYPYLAEDFGPSVVFVSPEDGMVYAGEGAIKAADKHATESSPKAFADKVAAGAVYSWLSAYGILQYAEDQSPSSVFIANGVASAGDQAYIEAARYRRAQAAAATLAPAATAEAAQIV